MFNESDNVELMQLLQEARQAAEEMDDRETSQQGSQPFNAAEHFLAHHTPDWLCSGERPHTGTEDLPNNHSSSTYSTCTTPAATATRLEKMLPHQQVHKVAASPSSLHASPMMNLGDEDGNQQELLTSYAAWLREQAGHPASMQRSPAYITRNLSSDFDRAPHHHGPDGAMAANTWSIMEGGVHGGAEMVPTLQDSPPHRPSSLPLWPPTTERAWTYTASISTIVAPSPNQAQPQPQQQQPQVPVGGVAGLPSTLAFSSASMDEKQRCVGVAMMDRGQTPVGLVGATNPPSSSPLSMRLYTPDQQVLYRDATTHDVANKGWALLGRATLPASASMTVPHHIVGANPSDATPPWSTAMGRASPPIHPHVLASSPTNPAALATHPSERPPPRPQTAFLTSIAPWTEAAGGRPTSALRPSERRGQGNGVVRTSIHGNNNNNNNNTTMASANSPTGRIILSPNLVSRRGGICADGSPTSQAAKPRLYPQHVLPGMGEASMASGSAPLVSLFVGTPTPTHPQHHHHHPPPHHNHSHSNTSGPYSQRRRNSSGGALSSTTSPGGILSSPGNTSGSGNNNASNREDVAALLRLLRGGSPVGAMQTSPALQSPVVFHRDEVHEEEVSLTVWELSRDQQGCRLLQAIFDKELHDGVMARLPPATVPHELDPNLLTSLKAEAYLQSVAIQRVLRAMEPRMAVIMSDAYGNFLVQKIFEVAPDAERCRLLRLPRLHLELGEVACSSHGTFAIQRLIETLRNPQEEEILFRALAINLLQLLTDVNGGHVLSKAVLYLRARYSTGDGLTGAEAKLVRQSDFLYQGICQHMLQVCQHRHGCCIIQRCLDFFGDIILTSATCVGEASARFDALVRQIIAHAPTLSVDPFGNYVLTHAVKVCYGKGRVYLIDELAQKLEKTSAPSPAQRRGREDGPGEGGVAASMDGTLPRWLALAYLCQNKFASNVMEQVLRFCSETTIRGVCRGLMQYAAAPHMNNNNNNSAAVPVLYDIVLNSFGNYVIQTLLTVAPVDELIHPETDGRSGMLPLLESYAPLLREKNFGKKVEAKLELARLRVAHRQA